MPNTPANILFHVGTEPVSNALCLILTRKRDWEREHKVSDDLYAANLTLPDCVTEELCPSVFGVEDGTELAEAITAMLHIGYVHNPGFVSEMSDRFRNNENYRGQDYDEDEEEGYLEIDVQKLRRAVAKKEPVPNVKTIWERLIEDG